MKTIRRLLYISVILIGVLAVGCKNADSGYCCNYTSTIQGDLPDVHCPNVITPNGDGQNDFLIIEQDSIDLALFIYDNSNNLVYHSAKYENDFNGIGNAGNTLDDDNYKAVFIFPTGNKEFTLTIVRSENALNGGCLTECNARDISDPLLK